MKDSLHALYINAIALSPCMWPACFHECYIAILFVFEFCIVSAMNNCLRLNGSINIIYIAIITSVDLSSTQKLFS